MAAFFMLPTVLTIANSFMSPQEIKANYGMVFNDQESAGYISEKVNLKFIPDMVTFKQFATVLLNSPEYLFKFWNTVIYTVPILIVQVIIAILAAYSFTRFKGRIKEILFFVYIILMLLPYQVTLVPNYLVTDWLGLLDTKWAIWLPGMTSPFSVFLFTKFMRRIPDSLIEAAKIDGRFSQKSAYRSAKGQWFLYQCLYLLITGIWLNSRLYYLKMKTCTHFQFFSPKLIQVR